VVEVFDTSESDQRRYPRANVQKYVSCINEQEQMVKIIDTVNAVKDKAR